MWELMVIFYLNILNEAKNHFSISFKKTKIKSVSNNWVSKQYYIATSESLENTALGVKERWLCENLKVWDANC